LKKALAALILAQAALALTLAATYPWMPERVATHFGPDGGPDGWESRSAYATYLLSASVLISALCAGPLYLARKLPDSLINIPERDYWLAPENRDEAHARLFALGLAIATATTVLFIALHLLTVRANRSRPPRLEPAEAFGLIAIFLVILGAVVWSFSARAWRTADRP
jgi:serine/threonine-protein kinase